MKKIIPILIIGAVAALFYPNPAKAQDRQFARTYQSNSLPKGATDIEAWATWRTGREYFYNRLDTRLEFEIGLTDRLQTALYLNSSYMAFGAYLDTLGRIPDTSVSGIFYESGFSVSSEWKWNIINPNTHPFGFALYAEFGFAPGEFEIENKLIFDKRTPKSIWALNLVNEYEMEYEVEKGETEKKWEDKVEIDLAYMYMLKTNFGLGLEVVNINEIEKGNWNYSALFGGPTMYYAGSNYFLILNILPQWANLHQTDDAPNSRVLNAQEKLEIRFLLGFTL